MRVFWLLCALLFIAPSVASSQEVDLSLQDELSFVSNDAFLIGIARPAKMFDVKAIADNPVANLSSPIGVKPSEVDYLVIALVPSYESASLLFSIKSKKPIDQENVRRLLSPRSEMLEDEFPIYDGQESGGMTLAFPKPDQLLFSQDAAAVFEALDRSPRKAQSGLSKMLEGGKNAHAQLVFDIAQLKHFVTFNSGEYRSFDGTIEKWFPPGTSQVQALLDLNTKIPFICKAFASKDVKEFQHAAQKSLDESKKQLELGNDESETAAMAAGMISGMRCSNIERGVLVQYERDGSLEEFVAGVLLDIKLARQMIARKADIIVAQNLIRRVVLGLLNFDSAYQKLPSNIESKDGVPLLSWRVAILPMLGEQELYDSFKLDQSWDSDHNKSVSDRGRHRKNV